MCKFNSYNARASFAFVYDAINSVLPVSNASCKSLLFLIFSSQHVLSQRSSRFSINFYRCTLLFLHQFLGENMLFTAWDILYIIINSCISSFILDNIFIVNYWYSKFFNVAFATYIVAGSVYSLLAVVLYQISLFWFSCIQLVCYFMYPQCFSWKYWSRFHTETLCARTVD